MNLEFKMKNTQKEPAYRLNPFCILYSQFLICCVLYLVCGCEGPQRGGGTPALEAARQTETLAERNSRLTGQLEQQRAENERLAKQIEELSKLPGEARLEKLYTVAAIKIGGYTNFYDQDKDGAKETLIVYFAPIDSVGDPVKAAGTVDVQLWDLNKAQNEAILASWHIEPGELQKMWFDAMLKINYRLTFNAAKISALPPSPLTVKVTFVDSLTGRTFTEQKVIKQ